MEVIKSDLGSLSYGTPTIWSSEIYLQLTSGLQKRACLRVTGYQEYNGLALRFEPKEQDPRFSTIAFSTRHGDVLDLVRKRRVLEVSLNTTNRSKLVRLQKEVAPTMQCKEGEMVMVGRKTVQMPICFVNLTSMVALHSLQASKFKRYIVLLPVMFEHVYNW